MTRHRIPVTLTLAPEVFETLRRRAAKSRLSLSVLVERIAVGLEPPVAAERRERVQMVTYRAAIYRHPRTGQELALTAREDAALPDDALLARAVDEAQKCGLIGEQEHQLSEEEVRQRIYIGEWTGR